MPQITDRCWVEVDLDKLRANYRAIEGIRERKMSS